MERLRVGIVGTGMMGQTHAGAWAQTPAEIVGFVSVSPEKAAVVAEKYGAIAFADLDEMLACIDVLDVCLPTHLHEEAVLAGARAGVHVVCEKPLARTVDQAYEMIQACDQAGVKLLVAHVVRFFPEYAAAEHAVSSGAIGDPAVIRLKRGTFKPAHGHQNWFLDRQQSGGLILDLMIHDFDYARWIGGDVKTVFAKSVANEHGNASVDHALAILTHENGAISHIEGSWAYPAPMFRTELEIAGSNGLIEHKSDLTTSLGIYFHQTEQTEGCRPLPSLSVAPNPYAGQLQSFYNHIVHNTPTPISAADALAALKIALAAIQSAESGEVVHLNPLEVAV